MSTKNRSEIIISVNGVTKTFVTGKGPQSKLFVLRGITLNVERGEIIAVVGASGAGKSTLLHIIGTLDRPTSGHVYYEGVNVFSLGDDELARFRNERIGFVFQFHHLLPEFTALENVAMPALIMRKKLVDVKPRALELLRDVGLEAQADQKPPKLSGGEQQRVAVARALMNAPRVVLADEPTGNLDTANADLLHRMIWDFSRKRGQTFVIVTHNEGFAKQADRIVRISDGVIG
jgi:lipoprotein-releasing system ATP-binding protein